MMRLTVVTGTLLTACSAALCAQSPPAAPSSRPVLKLGAIAPVADRGCESDALRAARFEEVHVAIVTHALSRGSREASATLAPVVREARAAAECHPRRAEAHYLLALALGFYLEEKGTREKIRLADEVALRAEAALTIEPGHAGAHHILGRLHAGAMRLGTIERFVARRLLGADLLARVSWREAERHFSAAREREPDNPAHAMELGALYLDTDRPGLAREPLETAAGLPVRHAQDLSARDRARDLLRRLGQPPSTISSYDSAFQTGRASASAMSTPR